jgi:multiple sugar transport system substrate-binding protein
MKKLLVLVIFISVLAQAQTLRVWAHQNNSFNAATQSAIDSFVAENPGVEVKLETFPWDVFIQTIQTSVPAGNTADVIQIPGGYTCRYGLGGQLLEVPAEIMTLEQAQEIFFAAPLGGQVCDGKLYGFPDEFNLEYGGAYVNQSLFEAAGLSYPPAWSSWSEVVADAQKLVEYNDDGTMKIAGMHYTNNDQIYTYFLSGILEQGGTYFADDGKHFNFNTPEAVAVIQKMIDMAVNDKIVDPVIYSGEGDWVGTSFAEGRSAIGVLGSWFAGEAKLAYPDLEFDYVGLPPFIGDDHAFMSVGGWGTVVGQSTENPDLAWKLAAHLTANEDSALAFAKATGTIPAQKAVAANSELLEAVPTLAAVLPILEKGAFQGDVIDTGILEFEIVYPNILDAIQGFQTAEEAAQNIHDQANAMVDSQ